MVKKPGPNKENSTIADPLSKMELQQLRKLERTIRKGWNTFIEVGRALSEIRDQKLYREQFKTFESYCKHHFGYSRSHAYRLIGAADVIEDLSPIGDKSKLPQAEAHVRPLIELTSEERKTVWERVIETSGDAPITVEAVKDAIAQNLTSERSAKNHPKRPSRIAQGRELVNQAISAFEAGDQETALIAMQALKRLLS